MQAKLLAEIEDYLKQTGMTAGWFGHLTINDGKLVYRLRSGGACLMDTAARIRRFMADNPAETYKPKRKRRRAA